MSGKFLQQIAVTKFYFSHYLWFYRYGVKSVQIRSYFWSETFLYSDWIRRFSPNTGKYGPEITPYLDTFHAVNLRIQFEYRKIRPRNNSVFGHFSCSYSLLMFSNAYDNVTEFDANKKNHLLYILIID